MLQIYGTSFYGSPLWDFYGIEINALHTTWNIGIRSLLGLPYKTHTRFLDNLSNIPHIKYSLKSRFIKFLSSLDKSDNPLIQQILQRCVTDNRSITGKNISQILIEYDIERNSKLDFNSIYQFVVAKKFECTLEPIDMDACNIIKELIDCLQGISKCGMNAAEMKFMINCLATE